MKKGMGIILVLLAVLISASACAEPANCPYDIHLSVLYNYLSAPEQQLYDMLYDALREGKTSFNVPAGVTQARAEWMIDFIYNEAPELCAYERWSSGVVKSGGGLQIRLAYKMPLSVQDAFIQTVAKETKTFSGKGDSKGIRAIHDAVIRRFTYGTVEGEDTQLAYFALKNNKAICNGYAQTAAMYAHFAGYTCSYVTGYVGENGRFDSAHAWNVACVDGRFMWFDATWDDSGRKAASTWYNLDGETMAQTHKPLSAYDPIIHLKTILPANASKTMHLDVNNAVGFNRGITDKSGTSVRTSSLSAGEYYSPAMVIYNLGDRPFSVTVSYSLEGHKGGWRPCSVQPGSNLAFRLNADYLKDRTGSHEIIWYVGGLRVGTFTWKVR